MAIIDLDKLGVGRNPSGAKPKAQAPRVQTRTQAPRAQTPKPRAQKPKPKPQNPRVQTTHTQAPRQTPPRVQAKKQAPRQQQRGIELPPLHRVVTTVTSYGKSTTDPRALKLGGPSFRMGEAEMEKLGWTIIPTRKTMHGGYLHAIPPKSGFEKKKSPSHRSSEILLSGEFYAPSQTDFARWAKRIIAHFGSTPAKEKTKYGGWTYNGRGEVSYITGTGYLQHSPHHTVFNQNIHYPDPTIEGYVTDEGVEITPRILERYQRLRMRFQHCIDCQEIRSRSDAMEVAYPGIRALSYRHAPSDEDLYEIFGYPGHGRGLEGEDPKFRDDPIPGPTESSY